MGKDMETKQSSATAQKQSLCLGRPLWALTTAAFLLTYLCPLAPACIDHSSGQESSQDNISNCCTLQGRKISSSHSCLYARTGYKRFEAKFEKCVWLFTTLSPKFSVHESLQSLKLITHPLSHHCLFLSATLTKDSPETQHKVWTVIWWANSNEMFGTGFKPVSQIYDQKMGFHH